MALQLPNSMDECVYFTRRNINGNNTIVWVLKEECPKCHKAKMGKPTDKKTGKVKIRAKEYTCPACGHTEDQQTYEDQLTASVQYTCPKCTHKGELRISFKRKKMQLFDEEAQKKKSVETLQFSCQKCSEKINVTKKMK